MAYFCFSCKKDLNLTDKKVGYREECIHCRADVHACKNCEFYDPKAYNECREPSADRVTEKERANYCDYFSLRSGSGGSGISEKDALKAAAEALFKKG